MDLLKHYYLGSLKRNFIETNIKSQNIKFNLPISLKVWNRYNLPSLDQLKLIIRMVQPGIETTSNFSNLFYKVFFDLSP